MTDSPPAWQSHEDAGTWHSLGVAELHRIDTYKAALGLQRGNWLATTIEDRQISMLLLSAATMRIRDVNLADCPREVLMALVALKVQQADTAIARYKDAERSALSMQRLHQAETKYKETEYSEQLVAMRQIYGKRLRRLSARIRELTATSTSTSDISPASPPGE